MKNEINSNQINDKQNYFFQNEMTILCDICGRKFANKDSLDDHLPVGILNQSNLFDSFIYLNSFRQVHSTEAPFKCKHCQKGFKWEANLMNHLKTHLVGTKTQFFITLNVIGLYVHWAPFPISYHK